MNQLVPVMSSFDTKETKDESYASVSVRLSNPVWFMLEMDRLFEARKQIFAKEFNSLKQEATCNLARLIDALIQTVDPRISEISDFQRKLERVIRFRDRLRKNQQWEQKYSPGFEVVAFNDVEKRANCALMYWLDTQRMLKANYDMLLELLPKTPSFLLYFQKLARNTLVTSQNSQPNDIGWRRYIFLYNNAIKEVKQESFCVAAADVLEYFKKKRNQVQAIKGPVK